MKRKINVILIVILIALSVTFALTAQNNVKGRYDYRVRVVNVVDGDTFDGLTRDKIEIRFRLFGIDAPEKRQEFGLESTEYLEKLILGKRVNIKVQKKRDGWGRPVVWVSTRGGQDVGAAMLKAGMAWHYKEFDTSPYYTQMEREAKRSKKGVWSKENSQAPWEFRKKKNTK